MQSVAAGIKRIEAKAGPAALQDLLSQRSILQSACNALHVNEKDLPTRVMHLQNENTSLEQSNAMLMRSALSLHQPAFVITTGEEKELRVYEVDSTLPDEYVVKLAARLKEEATETNRLILHNKSFTLLCGKEMDKEEMEKMKLAIFEVGKGGKGGGKKGIVKGNCNQSLNGKESQFRGLKW